MRSKIIVLGFTFLLAVLFIFPPEAQAVNQVTLRKKLLDLINTRRNELNLNNVNSNDSFQEAAQNHAEDMNERNYFANKSPENTGPIRRIKKVNSRFMGNVAQNIHKITYRSREQFLNQMKENWTRSKDPFYYFSPDSRALGIGLAHNPGQNVIYLVIKSGFIIKRKNQYRKKLKQKLLEEVNKFRRRHGLSLLEKDQYFEKTARLHSKNMVEKSFFSHRDPSDNSPLDRIQNIRSNYAQRILENLARHTPDSLAKIADNIVKGWSNSPAHRKNMLTEEVKKSGFGVEFDCNQNLLVITHNFGNIYN